MSRNTMGILFFFYNLFSVARSRVVAKYTTAKLISKLAAGLSLVRCEQIHSVAVNFPNAVRICCFTAVLCCLRLQKKKYQATAGSGL